jgi:hypothetical protein
MNTVLDLISYIEIIQQIIDSNTSFPADCYGSLPPQFGLVQYQEMVNINLDMLFFLLLQLQVSLRQMYI